MHAETVDAAIGRLTNPPINVPKQMITALDIICIQNQIRFTDEDGNAVNVRRNEETREIVSLRDNGQFENRRPFQWDAETDTFIQSLEDSHVLARIAGENGWTPEEKREELKQREEVLEYMVEEDIREFEYVTNIIQAYMVDPEKIIAEVRDETLQPDNLKSLTDLEWSEDTEKEAELNQTLESGQEDETPEIAQGAGDDV
jgi:flagellar protein FlaI